MRTRPLMGVHVPYRNVSNHLAGLTIVHRITRLLTGVVMLCAIAACHSAELNSPLPTEKIRINNNLQSCLTIKPLSVYTREAGVILKTQADYHQSLSECLCMTTVMNYQVSEERIIEGRLVQTEWVKGFRNTAKQQSGSIEFVLLTDPSYLPKGELVLTLRCRPHE